MQAAANIDRDRSFAAKRLAAYRGYDRGRYTNTHWKIRKFAATRIETPMRLTIHFNNISAVGYKS